MGLPPAGTAIVIVFVIIGVVLLVQLVYVLWYRRRFQRRSAGDSELASIISDRSGTPASKELALYFLYYRNQPPSQVEPPAAVPNNNAEAELASTSQTRVGTQEAPTMSMRPPVPEAVAAVSTDEEEEEEEDEEEEEKKKREEYEAGSPEVMMCPSFSGLVRDYTQEVERDERTAPSASASASASSGGGARSTSTGKDSGRPNPTPFGTPTTSPPFVSPTASPARDVVVEFKRYASKVARRVAMPS